MSKIKIFTIVLLISMLAIFPVGKALATSSSVTNGSGTIVSITLVTNGGITTVKVHLLDSNSLMQTVTVSLEKAIGLGLVITNAASIATEATLTDINTALTTTGTVNFMDFDVPSDPKSLTVNLTPIPMDVVIDATTAQGHVPPFVLTDVDGFMTEVDPLDFAGVPVTLTDTKTLVDTTGTVNSIKVDDPTSKTSTVTVNLIPDPTPFGVTISLEDAVSNELVVTNAEKLGTDIAFEESDIIDSASFGKVISKLGAFFAAANLVGVDFTTLQEYKDDGYGFGVITQALWMAANIGGDEATFAAIMEAKSTGDFSALSTTATNWGQFRKEILTSGKQNLGQIMSGKAELETTSSEITTTETETTNSKTNNGNGNGNGNSNDKSNNGNGNAGNQGNNNKNKP